MTRRSTRPWSPPVGQAIALAGWLAAATPMAALALEAVPVSHAEAVRRADVIVRGRVTTRDTQWNAPHTLPLTTIGIAVDEVLKGTPSDPLSLTFAGGDIDGKSYIVSDLPVPAVGAAVVVFAYAGRPPSVSPIVGANQWYFELVPNPDVAGENALVDAKGGVVVALRDGSPVAVARDGVATSMHVAGAARTAPASIAPDAIDDADGTSRPAPPRAAVRTQPTALTWTALRDATVAALAAQGVTP